jgi:hypothetical protein
MGISDYLKAKLSDLPGIDGATSELIGGEQVIHINGAEAHTGPFAIDTEIERAIRSALSMLDPEATEPAEPNVTPMPEVTLIEEPKKDEPETPVAKNGAGSGARREAHPEQRRIYAGIDQDAPAGPERPPRHRSCLRSRARPSEPTRRSIALLR